MDNDVYAMLADLEQQIDNGKKVPFTNQYVIDRDGALSLLQIIRDNLPEAIKDANRITKQESRIMQDAKKHYDNLVAEAEAKAKTLRMESEQRAELLTTNARQQADELVAEAQRQAQDTLDMAERKAEEMVANDAITIRAEQQANEIMTNARGEANRTMMATLDHCSDMLRRSEDICIEVANDLRDARIQLDQER